MQSKPVPSYAEPSYPLREELLAHGVELQEHVPERWRSDRALLGAVVFFLSVQLGGCRPANSTPVTPPSVEPPGPAPIGSVLATAPAASSLNASQPAAPPESSSSASAEPPAVPDTPSGPVPAAMKVAPIFEHGEGQGAVGCVVVSPPVFLSEEEAMNVLRDELAKHGVQLGPSGVTLDEVRIPRLRQHYEQDKAGNWKTRVVEQPGTAKAVQLDRVARNRPIAIEFVSRQDYMHLGGTESGSSVQSYEIKAIAQAVSDRLRKSGRHRMYVGVFYDPVSHIDPSQFQSATGPVDWESLQKAALSDTHEKLRQQARDFVAWLRQQGAL